LLLLQQQPLAGQSIRVRKNPVISLQKKQSSI
jgi:hypothetical protein